MMRHRKLALTAASAVFVAIAAGSCSSHSSSTPPPPAVTTSAAPSSAPATTDAPTTVPPTQDASPLASVPGAELTTAQQQAVDAAQGYLDLGSGFSYEGLLKQLTSQYGNGFDTADAKFAIGYLHPDWDAQAVEAAKGYMQLGGFSRQSLIDQLTSSYGSGFTYSQAVYAANAVGL